jgi:hypothetical protein
MGAPQRSWHRRIEMIKELEAAAKAVPKEVGYHNLALLHEFQQKASPEKILRLIEVVWMMGNEYHKLLEEHTRWTDTQIEALEKYKEIRK